MIQPIESMQDAFTVGSKNVIVTGGNKGVGFGITSAFAQCGANVAILNRNTESGLKAVNQLALENRGDFINIRCDLTDKASIREAVSEVYRQFEQVDILVNNAGISNITQFLDMDEEMNSWYEIFETDLHGTAHMVYEVANRMRNGGVKEGSIINISSIGGERVEKGAPMCAYSTAKAAVNHFTHVMSTELGKYNIRVNAIAPGFAWTQLTRELPESVQENILERMPLGRFGQPIEIGALAVFLASPAAAHITGDVIELDGGFSRCN